MRNKILGLFVLAVAPLCAQFPAQYYVGASLSYSYYGLPKFTPSTDIAVRIDSKLFSFSSVDFSPNESSTRTGIATVLASQGNWALVVFGNAGISSGESIVGSFSAGGFLAYDFGARLTHGASHLYLSIGERILNVTSQKVTPIFMVGLGKGF